MLFQAFLLLVPLCCWLAVVLSKRLRRSRAAARRAVALAILKSIDSPAAALAVERWLVAHRVI